MTRSKFELLQQIGEARLGKFTTRAGSFDTPNFMPVGTRASVKGVDVERLAEVGAQILLVNTYHLWLRPGPETIQSLGGIHRFMGWQGPILSDSGGFQVFSLAEIRKIAEEGVEFRSHLDGAKLLLSPEISIQVQQQLGVDIAMAFDECPKAGIGHAEAATSLALTLRWAARSLAARTDPSMFLFGITQGSFFEDLRHESAARMAELPFDGYAIGGLSVGESKAATRRVLEYHPRELPKDHIRYLMGVGTPADIVNAVNEGVDLFDCVMPTRAGRFGRAFVGGDRPYINVKNSDWHRFSGPLDEQCRCVACRNYSVAYINHLFKAGEMLGPALLSLHNLAHYLGMMRAIRAGITEGTFPHLYRAIMDRWRGVEGLDTAELAAD